MPSVLHKKIFRGASGAVENRHAPECACSSHASGIARTVHSSAVRRRVALASFVVLAAVVAASVWSDRSVARSKARAAPARDGAPPVSRDAGEPPAPADAEPACRIFGRVVDALTDAPVAGAGITAYAFATGRTLRVMSAADGSFEFADAGRRGEAFQVVARHEDDAFDFIDAGLVTDLKFKSPPKRRRRTA